MLLAIRVVHPFPSLLDGALVVVVALVAGAAVTRAVALGVSMVLFQFAIGALNDAVDAERDRARTDKAVARGLITPRSARMVASACAATGLVLAAVIGPVLLPVIALAGLTIGAWYDLAAKGTRLSWVPLALGVPLLPVYAWYGAAGSLPEAFAVLVPAAAVAGAGLAIANATADIERDRAAGISSLAVALGPTRAAVAVLGAQLLVALLAVLSVQRLGASGPWLAVTAGAALVPVAGAALGVAVARRGPAAREVAFEVQAVGLALLAVAWVAAAGAKTG